MPTRTRGQSGVTPKKVKRLGFEETPDLASRSRATQSPETTTEMSSALKKTKTPRKRKVNLDAVNEEEQESHVEANGNTNGHANGHVNGNANEEANGHANGHATNGDPKDNQQEIIDGDKKGSDSKVEFEFGGSVGTLLLMIGFPLLMYYMWIGATYYDGGLPLPENQTIPEFLSHLVHLVCEGAFPSLKAWTMYWVFFIFEGICYIALPGITLTGRPLPHLGGKQLDYYCSALSSFYVTLVVAVGLHFSGVFKLYTIIDEFGPLLSVAIISGFLVSFIAYFSALYRGAQHRMTGYPIYDFFMGAELNPRMFGILDFKMFFEVRLPWYILLLLTMGAAARQYELYGYVSGEVCFLLMAHFLYANACSKGEECIISTWDMYYEKWGFMLIFWNLAGVPLSYCHCTIYLANHHPDTYRWNRYILAAMFAGYLFVYWVWDTANSQKNRYRQMERGTTVFRNAFPQLPWQTLHNPEVIRSPAGTILVSGWYGIARKIHYSCDVYFALNWALITGWSSPFPWFYPFFFVCMISHRCMRDVQRCEKKYGDDWKKYKKQVPYLFIPYVF